MPEHMKKSSLEKVFGKNLFSDAVMREYLSKEDFAEYQEVAHRRAAIPPALAAAIAHAMRAWATERGATHFTHWFQPLHGVTAEKHEAFLQRASNGGIITDMSGDALVQGEGDASSFPSGGLRATFEARGFTSWDYTSPAFLKEDTAGVTLCIPTSFRSYNGQALDEKTPLLRSMEALNTQALRLLRLFGDGDTRRVYAMAGAEQEYFLVDRAQFDRRMDMVFCGRTLFGARPGKSQEMEGHYYGAIKERIAGYMCELDAELWKLGVAAKTRHNEAAPAQHELAPLFTDANLAADHNQLIMETMQRVAAHHNLSCLLHEKPFSYINGSGKHNNWSLSANKNRNLFTPGHTARDNRLFLTLVCAVVAAIDRHADLLRFASASAGNDLRLGDCEAPPPVISVFLGAPLLAVFEGIAAGGPLPDGENLLPGSISDDIDRNRTSAFAFTGNRFEFRMLPSSMSISMTNVVLDVIVAEALDEITSVLEQSADFDSTLRETLARLFTKHRRVIFNGNGYGDEWLREAEARGLPLFANTPDVMDAIISPKAKKLFTGYGVFDETELEARFELKREGYIDTLFLEASTMLEMTGRQILPACMAYQGELARAAERVSRVTGVTSVQAEFVNEMSALLMTVHKEFEEVKAVMERGKQMADTRERALLYRDELIPAMGRMRAGCDALERMTPDSHWPFPTYNELLFNI